MSVEVMTIIWAIDLPTTAHKLVALKLADCSNDDGENIYPSVRHVREKTGVAASTIALVLDDLEASGVLHVIDEGYGFKRGRSTTIRAFDLERLDALKSKLVEWRPVKVPVKARDGSEKERTAWRLFAVNSDDPSEDRTPTTPPTSGEVPLRPADDTSPTVGAPIREPSLNHHLESTPKSPDGGLEENLPDEIQDHEATGQSSPSKLLQLLREDGRHHNVVENLFAPILTQRRFSADDAIGELRSIRSAAKDLPKPALDAAVRVILSGPKTVKAHRIRDALKAATMVAKADAADAVPTDPDTERVRSALRKRLGEDVYRSWFAGMTVRNDGGRMLLVVPTPMHSRWVISNYTLHVEAVAGASARVVHAGEVRP